MGDFQTNYVGQNGSINILDFLSLFLTEKKFDINELEDLLNLNFDNLMLNVSELNSFLVEYKFGEIDLNAANKLYFHKKTKTLNKDIYIKLQKTLSQSVGNVIKNHTDDLSTIILDDLDFILLKEILLFLKIDIQKIKSSNYSVTQIIKKIDELNIIFLQYDLGKLKFINGFYQYKFDKACYSKLLNNIISKNNNSIGIIEDELDLELLYFILSNNVFKKKYIEKVFHREFEILESRLMKLQVFLGSEVDIYEISHQITINLSLYKTYIYKKIEEFKINERNFNNTETFKSKTEKPVIDYKEVIEKINTDYRTEIKEIDDLVDSMFNV